MVFKPVDGVGCGGLSIVKEEAQVEKAIEKIKAESTKRTFYCPRIHRGEAASVSLLSTGKKAMALSLNKQNIILAGSTKQLQVTKVAAVPFDYWLKQEAFQSCRKSC